MYEFEAFYSIYAPYLWIGLAGLVVLLALWTLALQIRLGRAAARYRELTYGINQGNLDDALTHQATVLAALDTTAAEFGSRLDSVERRVGGAVQRIGIVRFNPFNDTGGDQSFSIALLDGRGDGLVISSLFSRSVNRVFAKPILASGSPYALSEEEIRAIKAANDNEPAAIAAG